METGIINAHGYTFKYTAHHMLHLCTWCREAKEKAVNTMRDADLKTVTSHKDEPDDTRHTVRLERGARRKFDGNAFGYTWGINPDEPVRFTYKLGNTERAVSTTDAGLAAHLDRATPNERRLIRALQEERAAKRQRPVVLDMTLQEAASVVQVLCDGHREAETASNRALAKAARPSDVMDSLALRQKAGLTRSAWKRLSETLGRELEKNSRRSQT